MVRTDWPCDWLFKHSIASHSYSVFIPLQKRKENITPYLTGSRTKWWYLVLFYILCHNVSNSIISSPTLCLSRVVQEHEVWKGSCSFPLSLVLSSFLSELTAKIASLVTFSEAEWGHRVCCRTWRQYESDPALAPPTYTPPPPPHSTPLPPAVLLCVFTAMSTKFFLFEVPIQRSWFYCRTSSREAGRLLA